MLNTIVWLSALLAALGFWIMSGKATFLIAGYNTMSKNEQAEYDTKKLSRITGVFLILTSLLTALLGFVIKRYPEKTLVFGLLYAFILIIGSIVALILANKAKT